MDRLSIRASRAHECAKFRSEPGLHWQADMRTMTQGTDPRWLARKRFAAPRSLPTRPCRWPRRRGWGATWQGRRNSSTRLRHVPNGR